MPTETANKYFDMRDTDLFEFIGDQFTWESGEHNIIMYSYYKLVFLPNPKAA